MRVRLGNILWGIAFLAVGVGFLGNACGWWDFELFFDGWWTLFLIVPCFISLVQHGFHTAPLVGLGIGVLLLLAAQDVLAWDMLWKIALPLVFILIGLRILAGAFGWKRRPPRPAKQADGARRSYVGVFCANDAKVEEERFFGADLVAVFGGVELDLRRAVIEQDVVVKATAVFGGVDVYLPPNVKVELSGVPIFGGCDNQAQSCADAAAPTVYVQAVCVFGGVDVQ